MRIVMQGESVADAGQHDFLLIAFGKWDVRRIVADKLLTAPWQSARWCIHATSSTRTM